MKKTFRNVIIFALALCFVSAALSLCACKKTPQTIETDYCAYSEIPADYTPEQAEADGCLVVYQSQGTIKNSTVMTDFAKTTKKGSPALLRVATYYEKVVTGGEPELVVVDIEYKDGIYRTHYEQVNEAGAKEALQRRFTAPAICSQTMRMLPMPTMRQACHAIPPNGSMPISSTF